MKIFAMAASARKDSLNKKFILRVVRGLEDLAAPNIAVDLADFAEFEMPVYNGDVEHASGVPEGAKKLSNRMANADALIIAAPEYNGGIAGPLKNALDWVSRIKPVAFAGKPLLLIGASPGALGASRGLWHTRVPFEALGTLVYPEMFGLSHAGEAFAADGDFVDPKNRERLERILRAFFGFSAGVSAIKK